MNLENKNILKKVVVSIFILVLSTQVQAEQILWESGKNLHIKIDEQDKPKSGEPEPNSHPVKLDASELINALKAIKIYDRKEKYKRVFSIQQATLLGKYLAKGLEIAGPDEDILFALSKTAASYVVVKETYYMAGRAFYVDGNLNIIIGDYDRLPDKFQERAQASHGQTGGVFYFFKHGERAKPSKFNERTINTVGVITNRRDWYVIDVEKASSSYIAEQNRNRKPTSKEVVDQAIKEESERMAKERREMRLEMARMRKEMQEANNNPANELSIEERLEKLEDLHDKNLITDSEYDSKRKEILNDI